MYLWLRKSRRKKWFPVVFLPCLFFVIHFTVYNIFLIQMNNIKIKELQTRYYNFSRVRTPINGDFLIKNEHICKEDNLYMIIIVPSKPEHMHKRNAIRETYGSLSGDKVSELNGIKVKHIVRSVFVIGRTNNITAENQTFWENQRYADLVKIDILDSYYNLTLKMLYALKWVHEVCSDVQYVLKADDDVFVNVPLLLRKLRRSYHSETGNVFGFIFNSSKHFKVQRDDASKWSVTYEEFPLRQYPPYAQGTSYTLTRNLVPKIVHTAQFLPYLHVEDVLITGIIAGDIYRATLVHLNGSSRWGDDEPVPCQFVEQMRVAQTKMNAITMYKTWQALRSYPIQCGLYRNRKT